MPTVKKSQRTKHAVRMLKKFIIKASLVIHSLVIPIITKYLPKEKNGMELSRIWDGNDFTFYRELFL